MSLYTVQDERFRDKVRDAGGRWFGQVQGQWIQLAKDVESPQRRFMDVVK